jgi:thioredoxin reductase
VSHYDVVIIGGGPAGLAAAMYARQRGMSPLLLEAETFGGQLVNLYPSKPVDNFPAQPEVASRDLARRLADQAAHFGAELRELTPVEHVGRGEGEFTVRTDAEAIATDAIVLALGLGRFTPRSLGLESEQRYVGRGLTYHLPPRDRIEASRIVVVGGGDSAVDTALSLEGTGDVTLVHRGSSLRAYGRSQERLAASNVRVLLDAEVVELGGDDRLEHVLVSVRDQESVEVPADLAMVSIGQVPDLRGAHAWEIPLDDCHVAVDPAMATTAPGVFAAGDVASYLGKVKMIATAVADGSTAAASVERFLMMGGLKAV